MTTRSAQCVQLHVQHIPVNSKQHTAKDQSQGTKH